MVYSAKLSAAVMVNGKVVRETRNKSDDSDSVKIPFGSEYSIRFKNHHSINALVSISIDGTDVLDGNKIIITPGNTHDLNGFLKGTSIINRFKFIEKTQKISDYRGDKIEDGLIEISFVFEKQVPEQIAIEPPMYKPRNNDWLGWKRIGKPFGPTPTNPFIEPTIEFKSCNSPLIGMDNSGEIHYKGINSNKLAKGKIETSSLHKDLSLNDSVEGEDGITVKGSQIDEKVRYVSVGELEQSTHTIVIKLCGINSKNEKILTPILVRDLITCEICGTKNKSSNKFCKECGNNIQ